MKTILFWTAYGAVAFAANMLLGAARVGGWEWFTDIASDTAIYCALRWSIEPAWLRLDYKSRWFIIR